MDEEVMETQGRTENMRVLVRVRPKLADETHQKTVNFWDEKPACDCVSLIAFPCV